LISGVANFIMAVRPEDSYYVTSRSSLTVALMILIIVGILYFATVLITDLTRQYRERRLVDMVRKGIASREGATNGATSASGRRGSSGPARASGMALLRGKASESESSGSYVNPLLAKQRGGAGSNGNGSSSSPEDYAAEVKELGSLSTTPSALEWSHFRDSYTRIYSDLVGLSKEVTSLRRDIGKAQLELRREEEMADLPRAGQSTAVAAMRRSGSLRRLNFLGSSVAATAAATQAISPNASAAASGLTTNPTLIGGRRSGGRVRATARKVAVGSDDGSESNPAALEEVEL
jgi:hypothetical protein